jgi:hypothetical protein
MIKDGQHSYGDLCYVSIDVSIWNSMTSSGLNIPEDSHLHARRRENPKSHKNRVLHIGVLVTLFLETTS